MTTVSIVGARGRFGRALVDYFAEQADVHRAVVHEVARRELEPVGGLAERAATGVDIVINAAGRAHGLARDDAELERANVELPLALAGAALRHGASMIHISSTKAFVGNDAYARSKRRAEQGLLELDEAFVASGVRLTIVRPPAVLIPPFDAGKLRCLRPLRRLPRWLTPVIVVPAVTSRSLCALVAASFDGDAVGAHIVEVPRDQRATLRDVRKAMLLETAG